MKQEISPAHFVAHEILIAAVLLINSWAISLVLILAGVVFNPLALWVVLMVGRASVGAWLFLCGLPFTLSTAKPYPPLFKTAFLFLATSFLVLYFAPKWWDMDPANHPPNYLLGFLAGGVILVFILIQRRIILGKRQPMQRRRPIATLLKKADGNGAGRKGEEQ